jgi:hypothetical protein
MRGNQAVLPTPQVRRLLVLKLLFLPRACSLPGPNDHRLESVLVGSNYFKRYRPTAVGRHRSYRPTAAVSIALLLL